MDDQEPTIVRRSIDRWRREIIISQRQWMGHVLLQHPELMGQEEALVATPTNPEFVMRDTAFADRENFYRSGVLRPPHPNLYLKVVVEFRHTGAGEVVTAFPLFRIKRNEVQKWP